jgi:hypothetical protein
MDTGELHGLGWMIVMRCFLLGNEALRLSRWKVSAWYQSLIYIEYPRYNFPRVHCNIVLGR